MRFSTLLVLCSSTTYQTVRALHFARRDSKGAEDLSHFLNWSILQKTTSIMGDIQSQWSSLLNATNVMGDIQSQLDEGKKAPRRDSKGVEHLSHFLNWNSLRNVTNITGDIQSQLDEVTKAPRRHTKGAEDLSHFLNWSSLLNATSLMGDIQSQLDGVTKTPRRHTKGAEDLSHFLNWSTPLNAASLMGDIQSQLDEVKNALPPVADDGNPIAEVKRRLDDISVRLAGLPDWSVASTAMKAFVIGAMGSSMDDECVMWDREKREEEGYPDLVDFVFNGSNVAYGNACGQLRSWQYPKKFRCTESTGLPYRNISIGVTGRTMPVCDDGGLDAACALHDISRVFYWLEVFPGLKVPVHECEVQHELLNTASQKYARNSSYSDGSVLERAYAKVIRCWFPQIPCLNPVTKNAQKWELVWPGLENFTRNGCMDNECYLASLPEGQAEPDFVVLNENHVHYSKTSQTMFSNFRGVLATS